MYLARIPIINDFVFNLKNFRQPTVLITYECTDKDIERLRKAIKNIGHINDSSKKMTINNKHFGIVLIPREGTVYGWYLGNSSQFHSSHFTIRDIRNIYYIAEDRMINRIELEKLLKEHD